LCDEALCSRRGAGESATFGEGAPEEGAGDDLFADWLALTLLLLLDAVLVSPGEVAAGEGSGGKDAPVADDGEVAPSAAILRWVFLLFFHRCQSRQNVLCCQGVTPIP